ncbi:hypothetical protein Ancab_013495 [Ancistrocladus abbreviatus]
MANDKEFGGRDNNWGTKSGSHPSFVGYGRFMNRTKVGSMQPSYADIMKTNIQAKVGTMQPLVVRRSTRQEEGDESTVSPCIYVRSDSFDQSWLKDCFVGECYEMEQVTVLQDRWRMKGVYDYTLRPMGGRMVFPRRRMG